MRKANDFYPTPKECYEKLPIDWSQFKTALEPCKGDGRIVSFLENKGVVVDWCEIKEEKDFFDYNGEVDLIFTNPPYSLAQKFIEHSMSCAPTIIMLLRINFLGTKKRFEFWQQFPPDGMFILSKRPSFMNNGKREATEYAWYVWSDIKELQGFHWVL